jgi:hypothetical protein
LITVIACGMLRRRVGVFVAVPISNLKYPSLEFSLPTTFTVLRCGAGIVAGESTESARIESGTTVSLLAGGWDLALVDMAATGTRRAARRRTTEVRI